MNCDKCGRSMTTKSGTSVVGMSLTVSDAPSTNGEVQELYPELTLPFNWQVCWVCLAEMLGWQKNEGKEPTNTN